jgi:hypothetical protein
VPGSGSIPLALSVDAAELQIGAIWAQPTHRHQFRVKNSGDSPVIVSSISADCVCTNVTPSGFTLAPGADVELQVEFDLQRVKGRSLSRTEVEFGSELTFLGADGARRAFVLTGVMRYPFVISGNQTLLAEPLQYGAPPPAISIAVHKHPRVDQLQVRVAENEGEAQISRRLKIRRRSRFVRLRGGRLGHSRSKSS